MATKKDLLKHLSDYTPEEIAEAVQDGTVTLYELGKETEGAFTPLLKKKVKEILANPVPVPKQQTPLQNNTNIQESNQAEQTPPIEATDDEIQSLDIASVVESTPIEEPPPIPTERFDDSMSGYSGMFRKPFSFHGRIRRTEYGLTLLILMLLFLLMSVIVVIMDNLKVSPPAAGFIVLLYIIFWFWLLFAQGAKRCHDKGRTGWFQLILPIYIFWMLFEEGDREPNKYGNSPK